MSKLGFDPSELQQGAKGLHHTSVSSKHSSKTDPDEKASLSQLGKLTSSFFFFLFIFFYRGII